MKWLNLAIIRLFEFITLLLYSFFVLTYFGAFLLLPLDVLSLLIQGAGLIGLPAMVSVPVAMAAVGFLGYQVYRLPKAYQAIVNGGIELANAGRNQIGYLEEAVDAISGQAMPGSPSTSG